MSDQDTNPIAIANFEFVQRTPIEATFTISPHIHDLNYTHYQDVPSATWTIKHGLGKHPSVTVVTSAGEKIEADVLYKSLSVIEINFSGAFAGVAYLN
jgi:hypothetical protein